MRIDLLSGVKVVWCRTSRLRSVNYCWLVVNPFSYEAVVIDPAWEIEKINERVDALRLNMRGVLLTHHHHDHTNLAQAVADLFDVKIYISETEQNAYNLSMHRLEKFGTNDKLNLAGLEVRPILTPGHTAGSVCYWIDQALFTGDTLFNEGCGLCYGPGADPSDMFDSLKLIKKLLPDDTVVYPGHRYLGELGRTMGELKMTNLYLNIDCREKFVAFRNRAQSGNKAFDFI